MRAIREKANEARRLEERAAKRRGVLIQGAVILGVLVVVAAVVAVIVFANNNRVPQAVPAAAGTTSILGVDGIPLTVDATAVTVGEADAPVKIDLYEDYSCPHCAEYEAQVGSTIDQLIADGAVVVSYHPIRFVTAYGQSAGSAATCIAVEDPLNWPAYHSALFANHDQASDGWKPADFADFARAGGVTGADALDCIQSAVYTDWILSNTQAAQENGVSSTPTMLINGEPIELLNGPGLIAAVEAAQAG